MGYLVDLTLLVTRLVERVQDRKFAAELRDIQRMIGNLQLEHAALHEQNMTLRIENMQLIEQAAALKQRLPPPGITLLDGGD
jgi:hypothetical protein